MASHLNRDLGDFRDFEEIWLVREINHSGH